MLMQAAYMNNGKVFFSVSDSGAIGVGPINTTDYTKEKGLGLVKNKHDYINGIGIPFEFFSLEIDGGDVYANDNADGYKHACLRNDRENKEKNIPTSVSKVGSKIIAITEKSGLYRITHTYQFGKGYAYEIEVTVKVENLATHTSSYRYTRGVDMDPPGNRTIQHRGYKDENGCKNIPSEALIYTVSPEGNSPLSLFAKIDDDLPHKSYLYNFKTFQSCIYDPKNLVDGINIKENESKDAIIYMVFNLGSMAPRSTKTFKFSYILDDDLKTLANNVIQMYYPQKSKVIVDQPTVQIMQHNEDRYKKAMSSSFVVKEEAGKCLKPDKRRHKYKLTIDNLPIGVMVSVGGQKLTHDHHSVTIPFRYNKKIDYTIWTNREFKSKTLMTLSFMIDKGGEALNNTFELKIKPKYYASKSESSTQQSQIAVIYQNTRTAQKVGHNSFTTKLIVDTATSIRDDRTHHYKLSVVSIPEGITLDFGGERLSVSHREITVPFVYNQPIEFDIYRDYRFREPSTSKVVLRLDKVGTGDNNSITFEIIPKPRDISFAMDGNTTKVIELSKLMDSTPILVQIKTPEGEIVAEEYGAFDLRVNVSGIDGDSVVEHNRTAIKLKLRSLLHFGWIPTFFMTTTGESLPIQVSVRHGFYPHDSAEGVLSILIHDDMTWWQKYRMLVYTIGGILLAILYIIGLMRKNKFQKQCFDKHRVLSDGDGKTRMIPPTRFVKKVNWWQKPIPYRSERVRIDGMLFIATGDHQSIYLSKKTQRGLMVGGFPIDPVGRKNEKIYKNTLIQQGNVEYYIT